MQAVPPPAFDSLDLALADTEDAPTKRSLHAMPPAHVPPVVLGYVPSEPSWLYRARRWMSELIDPRTAEIKRVERQIINGARDAYHAERRWHWRQGPVQDWQDAKIALERNTGALIRAEEKL